jgi:two-component system chemotaxis sensor kinase CheA
VSVVDLSRYLGLFVAEAREHLASAQDIAARPGGLAASPEALRDLLRHAHSIKGMASSMGYRPMAALAHAIEDLLDACRRGETAPRDDHATLVGDGLSCLERMVDSAERNAPVEDLEAASIAVRLREARGSPSVSPPAVALPGPAEAAAARRLLVRIALSPQAPTLPVQAAMILGQIGKLGRVVKSAPPAAAMRMGRVSDRLEALVETEREPGEFLQELRSNPVVASVRVEPVATEPVRPPSADTPASWLRVRADLLDVVLERVLELMFEQGRLASSLSTSVDRAEAEHLDRCRALARELHADVMEMRLVGFDAIAHRLSGAVHELARRLDKRVRFTIEGRDVRMDRSMLEALVDPLLHMVRNAVDHGIESPEKRKASGKDASGRITLAVERCADRILITLVDDGAGLDAAALRIAAVDRGLLRPTEAARLGEADSLMLATLPGFSTAPTLSDVSGRGVGLDAARAGIEALGGRLTIQSKPGNGASMKIALPLTLAVIRTLLVRSRGHLFALPASAVERMLSPGETEVPADESSTGETPAVVRLDERLQIRDSAKACPRSDSVLLCAAGGRRMALVVDEVLGRKDVVVKPLRPPIGLLREYSGAALLEDGSAVLVLDPAALLD